MELEKRTMVNDNDTSRSEKTSEPADDAQVSRRAFLQSVGASTIVGFAGGSTFAGLSNGSFTVIDHIHQTGVGWYFRDGYLNGKHYRNAYSIFYGLQKTIDALHRFPWLTICLEFDAHAYEAAYREDASFVQDSVCPLVSSGKIDIVGGTYSQPYSSLIGWQSNLRQFVEGRTILREVLHTRPVFFVSEEIFFHPQVPQLLKLCGYRCTSLDLQNNGSLPVIKKAVVTWEGLDGTAIPTIPHNPWVIPLTKQYQALDSYSDQDANSQRAMLSIWSEIWPPGMDWGASYSPYDEGLRSLRAAGLEPSGLSEYSREWMKQTEHVELRRFRMDDAIFLFGWPQNKGLLWETIGGWGFDGDALLKENCRLEHELHATELLLSLHPDEEQSELLRNLWKKLMMTQCHDCFIVSGFPGEYDDVLTTNLQITKMMAREVQSGIDRLRHDILAKMTQQRVASAIGVMCQNPSGIAVSHPVLLQLRPESGTEYFLEGEGETIELQRDPMTYTNEDSNFIGIVDLPPCGFKTYRLMRRAAADTNTVASSQSGQIENEYYSISWSGSAAGFEVFDKKLNQRLVFRPFTGEITRVKESWWAAPNTGENFRAKDFREVVFKSALEAKGSVYQTLGIRGDILTLNTTSEPATWVTARAMLYKGLPRIDFRAELHTVPRMKFLAFMELELGMTGMEAVRDFPFGEEAAQKEQFSALNYVRLQAPGYSVVLAHGGTQQFFCEQSRGDVLIRNMIAREVLKGSYRWRWSLTSGRSFTPAESYRFAEASRGPVVSMAPGLEGLSHSWISTREPAVVIFRLGASAKQLSIWLMNFSSESRQADLQVTAPFRACSRADFDGGRVPIPAAALDIPAGRVRISLAPWEITALEIDRE